MELPADPKGALDQPAQTPEPDAAEAATPQPDDAVADATPEPEDTGNADDGNTTGDADPVETTKEASEGDVPSRLVEREPGPLTLWIILPQERFTVQADETCIGAGAYADVQPGGVVSLLDQDAGAAHIESVMIESPGTVYFDSVLQQDVCAFRLDFTSVTSGTTVLVDLNRIVLGRFDHVAPAPAPGEPAVYEIVVGE